MILASLTIYHVRLPLHGQWQTAATRTDGVETLVVRGETDDGHVMWTESCPLGDASYLPDTAATCVLVIRDLLAPRLLRQDLGPRQAAAAMDAVRGWPFAKAALEPLYWLRAAAAAGEPLWRHIGGRDRAVDCGVSYGRQRDVATLVRAVTDAVHAGAPRVKLKIMPGWDVEPVRAVRYAFPNLPLSVDANGSYTLEDVGTFRLLDAAGLLMIEQPLHFRDIADHAVLQAELQTPICLDESITCEADAERAIRHHAARAICLKPARLGGIGPTLDVHRRCQDAGVGCWIGGMLETGLGTALSLALATLSNCRYPADLHPCGHFHDAGVLQTPLTASGRGQMRAPSAPGLGVEPDEAYLRAHAVQILELPAC